MMLLYCIEKMLHLKKLGERPGKGWERLGKAWERARGKEPPNFFYTILNNYLYQSCSPSR